MPLLVSPVAERGWDFPFWTSRSHSFSFISGGALVGILLFWTHGALAGNLLLWG